MSYIINSNQTELIKHTAAVHISNTLTLIQRKVANILLKNAFNDLLKGTRHSITISEICNLMGWHESNNYDQIKEAFRALNTTQVEWNIIGKDNKNVWSITTILADAQIKEGLCTYEYSTTMKELLSKPNIYAKLNLLVQKNFRSKHALALWEYLIEALCSSKQDKMITEFITLEGFKNLLGIRNNISYTEYRRLNEKIISPSLNEINEESDIKVEVILKKEGRKVIALAFCVERKKVFDSKNDLNLDNSFELINFSSNLDNNKLTNLLVDDFNFSKDAADKLINKYEIIEIEKAINFVQSKKDQKIDSLPAYIVTVLKEKWYNAPSLFDKTNKTSKKEEIIVDNQFWHEVREIIKKELGKEVFLSWFNEVKFIKFDRGIIYFSVKLNFIKEWIENKHMDLLLKSCKKMEPLVTEIIIEVYKENV